MRKSILFLLLSVFAFTQLNAQEDIVNWSFSLSDKGNGEIELVAKAKIKNKWHLYDVNVPEDGPNATEMNVEELKGATKLGKFTPVNSNLKTGYDEGFQMNIGYYENQATFVQRFKVTDKAAFSLKGEVRAQACNDSECTPHIPTEFAFSSSNLPATLTVVATMPQDTKAEDKKEEVTESTPIIAVDTLATTQISSVDDTKVDLWAPVEMDDDVADKSLFWIFIGGLAGGFIALVTPCVWPMIPMTVSFFLKRNKKDKKKAIVEAATYGLAIIVIYVLLGIIITAIFGASALNDMATNAVFNLIFFALLIFFAVSFFGAFEIVLPSKWTNKMDSKADSTTGIISIFFMAFTLALVSFSCTGPIIGTLLVQSATSGAILAPAIGMFGFALALSIPFTLFAIFPSWLDNLPKSGGWLNSVKVVLGFLELALALKFLSVADLAYKWRILDREVFVALWIIIFVLLGLYLLGKLRFSHDSESKFTSVPRLFMATISLAFAVYLVPGLWGAPLKAISAFAPPLWTQDFSLYEGAVHPKFMNYEEGMVYAKEKNKPVIIDFSGYGCTNCRNMEAAVWTDPRVKDILDNQYVLITLMVDDKEKLPEILEVKERNGKTTRLKTIGDKWSYLQRYKFATNSQPYYVLLNHEGKPIGPSYAYDKDVNKYLDFLKNGLTQFNKEQKTK